MTNEEITQYMKTPFVVQAMEIVDKAKSTCAMCKHSRTVHSDCLNVDFCELKSIGLEKISVIDLDGKACEDYDDSLDEELLYGRKLDEH